MAHLQIAELGLSSRLRMFEKAGLWVRVSVSSWLFSLKFIRSLETANSQLEKN